MPVVPIRKADSRGQGFSPMRPIDLGEAEPWALMAAAQMDAEGRLMAQSDLARDAGAADLDQSLEARRGS